MQLNRKTSGDWKDSRDYVSQDLDTIMRTMNQQAQLIAALQASLAVTQAQLTNPNIAVAANGQVSGLANSKNLQTVAHDGSLYGLGTPASPLKVVSSGAAVTPVLYTQTSLTKAAIEAAAATPMTILAGVTGVVYIPLWVSLNWKVTTAYSNSPSWRWAYTGAAGNFMVTLTPGLTGIGTFYSTNSATGYNALSTTSVYSGKGIEINLNIAPTVVVGPPRSDVNAIVTLAYYAATVVT